MELDSDLDLDLDVDVDVAADSGQSAARPSDESARSKEADWSGRQSSANQFQPFGGPNGSQSPQSCCPGHQPPPSSKSLESGSLDSGESMLDSPAAKSTTSGPIHHSAAAAAPEQARDTPPRQPQACSLCELRLLVRRREAGALIGKRGSNIKRLRDSYRSCMLTIPDTGNGPERIACILADQQSMLHILADVGELLLEKSAEKDDQIELKLLIHSSQAGSIIGVAGQSIKKLRNESKAAIKIYELCCPYSNERVCAIKARPPVVVSTIQQLQLILADNPPKGPLKPYDASHFDPMLCDKYGGYLPDSSESSLELVPRLGPLSGSLDSAAALQAYSRLSAEAAALQSSFHLAQQHQHQQQQLAAAIDQTTRHSHYQRLLYQQQQQQQANSAATMELGLHQLGRRRKSECSEQQPLSLDSSEAADSETSSKQSNSSQPSNKHAAPTRSAPRFHPYSAEGRVPSMHQLATRMAPYERLMRLQPALLHHQHQQQLLLANLPQTAPSLSRCRHLRPCLCIFMGPVAAANRGLQPFAANLINYQPNPRLPTTNTKEAPCFGAQKK